MFAALIPVLGPIVERLIGLIPNENERAKAKEDLERSISEAANKASELQAETNLEQAKHSSIFVAGARPFIMWICGFGLGWTFVFEPVLTWGVRIAGYAPDLPPINTEGLMSLTLALLGLGAYRTFERFNGVERNSLR